MYASLKAFVCAPLTTFANIDIKIFKKNKKTETFTTWRWCRVMAKALTKYITEDRDPKDMNSPRMEVIQGSADDTSGRCWCGVSCKWSKKRNMRKWCSMSIIGEARANPLKPALPVGPGGLGPTG